MAKATKDTKILELALANPHSTGNDKGKSTSKLTCEDIIFRVEKGEHIFYFDKENTHKDMQKARALIEKSGYNAYLREVKYEIDESSYIYELHII